MPRVYGYMYEYAGSEKVFVLLQEAPKGTGFAIND